jgi:UDP-N-acetylmuramoyl-tripeptide--D-alanyl-D-alanine ligase
MCTAGNYNSTIGLPISIFTIAGDEDACILEMGASEPNEIAELCRIAKPTMGLITNISASHTENFGSLENVAKTKSDLFRFLPKDGMAFVNIDDNYISKFSTHANRITYGFKADANFNGDYKDGILKINNNVLLIPYPSEIMAKNILAAFAIANTIGISHSEIENSINTFVSPIGRCNIITDNGITIIDDSYNSNLESAKAGIDILSEFNGNQKIAIIGDMLELGELAQDHHYELGKYISSSKIDILLATGDLTQLTVNAAKKIDATFFHNKEDLISKLTTIVNSGDVVYVKGSRGMKMETIIKKGLSE